MNMVRDSLLHTSLTILSVSLPPSISSFNRYLRWMWKFIGVFTALWIVYAIVVGFDLLKFKFDCSGGTNSEDECFKLDQLSISDLCGIADSVNGTKATRISCTWCVCVWVGGWVGACACACEVWRGICGVGWNGWENGGMGGEGC